MQTIPIVVIVLVSLVVLGGVATFLVPRIAKPYVIFVVCAIGAMLSIGFATHAWGPLDRHISDQVGLMCLPVFMISSIVLPFLLQRDIHRHISSKDSKANNTPNGIRYPADGSPKPSA